MVYSDGRYRQLFFEGGNIVSASTNVEDERLGEVMYRFGAISREQLELILKASGGAGRFGSKAVELGVLSQEVVFSALRRQIEEIVFRSLAASSGTFYFLNDFDDSAIGMRVAISGTGLLMEALTRMDEVKYFEQKIPGAHCVPERTSKIGSDLSSDQKNLLSFIDGSQDIEQLGRSIGRGEFSTTKEIYALLQAGYLTIHNPNFASDEESVVSDASSVLQVVFRMAKERGILDGLMQSLNGFASSVGLYPILFGGDAGPDEQGAFNGETMLQNVRRLAPDEPMSALRQMLHDYLSFAVFSVGSSLGSEQEQELRQEIAEAFSRVAPGR